jgi:peptide/nickel transport system permease protein
MSARNDRAKNLLNRIWGFFKIFLGNKRGLLGVIIILFFTFMAILAPVLTPYSPLQEFLTGYYAAPLWIKYLPTSLGGEPHLSENMQPIYTDFSQGVNSGWNLTKDSAHISDLQMQPGIGRSNYSLMINFTRDETGAGTLTGITNASVGQDFYFPYVGTPYRYMGSIEFLVNGTFTNASATEQYYDQFGTPLVRNITVQTLAVIPQVHVFLERLADQKRWEIWPNPNDTTTYWQPLSAFYDNITISSNWLIAHPDSFQLFEAKFPKLFPGSVIGAIVPDYTFVRLPGPLAGYYRYGLDIKFLDVLNSTIPATTTIYVDYASLTCWGKSWGLLGADNVGRDLWSQLVFGSQISLIVGLLSAAIGVSLGLVVGLAAGFIGGAVDEVLMRFSDLLLVIPFLPLMLVLVSILGSGIENLIIIIGFLGWMGFARVIRSQVLSLKERPFIEAARSVGAGRTHIIVRHVIPNVMPLVYVTLASSVPGAITLEASLAFLGFSDPYRMSWGRMLNGAFFTSGSLSWWWVIIPGLCIAALAMAFILLGFALDEVMNPRLRLRR